VHSGDPGFHIHHKDDGVGLIDGQLHLFVYFLFKDIIASQDIAPGIDYRKFLPVPIALTVMTIPCDPTGGVHNRLPTLYKAVEQCGFSHIRPSHNGYYSSHSFKILAKVLFSDVTPLAFESFPIGYVPGIDGSKPAVSRCSQNV